jgi:hypothetical protein
MIYGEKLQRRSAHALIPKRCTDATRRPPQGARTLWFTQVTIEKLSCDSFMTPHRQCAGKTGETLVESKASLQDFDSEWFLIRYWRRVNPGVVS